MNYFSRDLQESLKIPDQWLFLAWHEIRSRYRRTKLGPIWIVLVNLFTIACFSVVSAALFKQDISKILPHVAAGLFVFSYIATILTDACAVYSSQSHLLQNMRTNPISLSKRLFVRNTIAFLHSIPILLLISITLANAFSWKILLFFPGMVLIAITSISLGLILGMVSARFRDIAQVVQSLVTVMPFMTPILWTKEMLGSRAILATINPLTHYIALIRDPILGNPISLETYTISCFVTALTLAFAILIYNKYRNRLVFWL